MGAGRRQRVARRPRETGADLATRAHQRQRFNLYPAASACGERNNQTLLDAALVMLVGVEVWVVALRFRVVVMIRDLYAAL